MVKGTRQARSAKSKKSREQILKEKLHRQDLTAEDVQEIVGADKDKFAFWMERMCQLYKELKPSMFKEGKYYKFKKEWHSLFLVLFESIADHPEYNRDPIKHGHTINHHNQYYKRIRENMEKYMTPDEIIDLKVSPSYVRAELEAGLLDSINREMARGSTIIQLMPEDMRFAVLAWLNKAIEAWNLKMAKQVAEELLRTAISERDFDEQALKEAQSYRRSFDRMLAFRLERMVSVGMYIQETQDPFEGFTEDSPEMQAFVNAQYERLIVQPWRQMASAEIQEWVECERKRIVEGPSNEAILERVTKALEGVDDARAIIIKHTVEQVIVILTLAENLKSKESFMADRTLDKLLYKSIFEELAIKKRRNKRSTGESEYLDDSDLILE